MQKYYTLKRYFILSSVEGYYNHCLTYITEDENMIKPTFRPREDLINQLHVPTTKMQRLMRKQTPRGDELVINCQRFNSNSNITSFSTKKNPSTGCNV